MSEPFKVDTTTQALLNAFSKEETERRDASRKNKDFFYDRQEAYVDRFTIEAIPVIIPITRPIIKKRTSLLYKQKLVREITGPSESINFLEDLYTEQDIDNIMLQADLLADLTGTVLLSLVTDESKESKFRITLWDGSSISALTAFDNNSELDALSLVKRIDRMSKGSKGDQVQVESVIYQQIWTKEIISTYVGTTNKTTEANELGFIPFAVIKGEEVANQFYGFSPANSVVSMNQAINQSISDLAYTIKLQGASPIALIGFQGGESLIVQPGKAINLPAGADAKVLSLDPHITETLDTIKFIEQKIYETSSVPEVSIVGNEGISGRELLIRWYPLVQVYEEKSIRFQKYELDVANTFLKIAGLPPVESVNVKYDSDSILPLDPEDENVERDIRLGLVTAAEILQKRNPELTEDEAIDKINSNLEITKNTGSEEPENNEEMNLDDSQDNQEDLEDDNGNTVGNGSSN
jgi:hypothetical protein